MGNEAIDVEDIQGLLVRGYRLPHIRYIIFKINNVSGAQAFCKALLPSGEGPLYVTTAEQWPAGKPDYCLNIGFTYAGLELLVSKPNCDAIRSATTSDMFSYFKAGAVKDAPGVGDTGDSGPAKWWQDRPGGVKRDDGGWLLSAAPDPAGNDLHIQVTLFALTPELRTAYYSKLLGMIQDNAIVPAFFQDSDPVADDPDIIHFGYKDSLSQPRIDSLPAYKKSVESPDERPLVPVNRMIINAVASPAPPYTAHSVLTNGSFGAFRLLHQDVGAFHDFINKSAEPDLVAAKMCGRWFDGTPLVVSPDGKNKPELNGFDFTNFDFLTPTPNQKGVRLSDADGALCPYAAHIRRTNPRDDVFVKGNSENEQHQKPLYADIHRVLRRASPYGPPYKEGEQKGIQRGLVGLFIGVNLKEQFHFIMESWVKTGGFRDPDASPNLSGADPLFGPMNSFGPNQEFDYNTGEGKYEVMTGLTRFIRTDGGLYVFLPGINGLRLISQGKVV